MSALASNESLHCASAPVASQPAASKIDQGTRRKPFGLFSMHSAATRTAEEVEAEQRKHDQYECDDEQQDADLVDRRKTCLSSAQSTGDMQPPTVSPVRGQECECRSRWRSDR